MVKGIIFPVNNKGGVGKTSLLADISAALAQRHPTALLDTDHQASLTSTLLGTSDLVCRDLSAYDPLHIHSVTLAPAAYFVFSDPESKMILDVRPTQAKVLTIPVGLFYEHPERQSCLETLLHGPLADVDLLAVDLPPLPHPSLVLDYTIAPWLAQRIEDVHLFPLIISTPDHNVIDMGLRQYALIADYFQKRGVDKEHLHPLSIVNKVPFRTYELDGKLHVDSVFQEETSLKLQRLGMLHIPQWADHGKGSHRHFNKRFDFEGRIVRSVFLPFIQSLADGRYALFSGKEPKLFHYSHLVDLVASYHYAQPQETDLIEGAYTSAMRGIVHFIAAHAQLKPHKNYIKRRELFSRDSIFSDTVKDLRTVLASCYREDKKIYTERITQPAGASSEHEWFALPSSIPLECLADALYWTQHEIWPGSSLTREFIRHSLRTGSEERYDASEISVCTAEGYEILGAQPSFSQQYRYIFTSIRKEGWNWKQSNETVDSYLGKAEIFLRHLERALHAREVSL